MEPVSNICAYPVLEDRRATCMVKALFQQGVGSGQNDRNNIWETIWQQQKYVTVSKYFWSIHRNTVEDLKKVKD
jgi:hypothetical protein